VSLAVCRRRRRGAAASAAALVVLTALAPPALAGHRIGRAKAAPTTVLRFYSAAAPGAGADVEAGAPALYAYLERSINQYGPMARAGQDTWVTLAYYFPAASYQTSHGWFGLWGVKGWGGASFNSIAPWNLDGSDGRLKVEQNSGAPNLHWDAAANQYEPGALPQWGALYNHEYDLGAIAKDRWTTIVLHFHWAHDTSGVFQAWRDGKRVVSVHTPTLAADDDRMRWPHQTAYRPGPPRNTSAVVFYQAPMHVGPSLAAALRSPPAIPPLSTQVSDGSSRITAASTRALHIPSPPSSVRALLGTRR
jgi:hypothetical protein